jgi:glycoside/pentoside/hexuronide:cation symporter, GPH family
MSEATVFRKTWGSRFTGAIVFIRRSLPEMTAVQPALPAQTRLPLRTKLIYGLGDWGNTTTSTFMVFFFAFFLTDVARLAPLYVAPVLLIGGIWDAVNDPLIGILADRVHTRWGRRRPLFLFGAIPLSLTFIMLWWVPPWQNPLALAAYYTIAYILFDTAFTLVTVPYSALTAELTEDYDERTGLTGFRMATSMAGGLIAAVVVPLLAGLFPEPRTGYFLAAVIFGILASVPYFVLFANIRERVNVKTPPPLNVVSSFVYTFRNRAFRYAAGIYMTAWMTVNLVASLMVYYLTYYMKMPAQIDIVLGMVQASALLFIPVMVWLSRRLGKQASYAIGLSWWAVVMLVLAFLPPAARTLAYILGALAGFGIAAAHVIPFSIIPDVIEIDELETGQRREGAFYGFVVFIQKTGTAFVLAFVQWILHLSGYTAGTQQPASAVWAIRMLIGPLPCILLVISMLLAWRFPINRERHAELRAQLAEKRMAAADD